MSGREQKLRAALGEAAVPGAVAAEQRALALVRVAAAERGRDGASRPARSPSPRRALQVALAVGLLAIVISPAGAAVRDWVGDAVEEESPPALPALTALPTEGSLLVDSARGPWIVREDGSKRLLGSYPGARATWSPHGLFVAVADLHSLAAIDPLGAVRWTLSRDGPVRGAAWSPDGNRIAYLDGADLRLVVGDGSADRLLAAGVAPVTPAWDPSGARVLAFVDAGGRVEVLRADSGRRVFHLPGGPPPEALAWSRHGSVLLVVRPGGLEAYDREGRLAWQRPAPPATLVRDVAPAPDGRAAAVVLRGRTGAVASLRMLGPNGGGRTLFEGPGNLGQVEYSPDGSWLLLSWPSADQWLYLDLARSGRTVAIADIAAQFDPGSSSGAPFPRLAGWCCSAGTSG